MSVKKLKTVLKDIDQARGLPNEHYICPQTHKLENNRLFFKTWAAVAFEADVKNPGQAFPVDFLGVPLLVINDKENSIKCNQCEKPFKSDEDIRQHIMSVHKGQPYYCDYQTTEDNELM